MSTGLVSLALYLYPLISYTSEEVTNILILKSGESRVYDNVADYVQNHFHDLCAKHGLFCGRINIQRFVFHEEKSTGQKYSLVITLGLKARQHALKSKKYTNIINAMIPSRSSNHLQVETGIEAAQTIMLDQPVERNLQLLKTIIPTARHVGVLLSSSNKDAIDTLTRLGQKMGLVIHPRVVANENEIGRKLSQLMKDIDVLLALPDKGIHNRKTVSNILLSTYRRKIPLFGFSAAYVRAGALAAVYSTPEDIGRHIAETAKRMLSKQLQPSQRQVTTEYPKYFSVSVNKQVAHSLGIQLPAAPDAIKELIQRNER